MQAQEISRTGLDVEWRRLEVIAQNLANLNSTRAADGAGLYQPVRLVSGPKAAFANLLGGDPLLADLGGVAVLGVEPTGAAPRKIHEPGHPDADAQGFVTYPGVDQAGEMTLMMKTARSYEANIVAMNAARQMYAHALDIGKRS